ncbi:MAG: AAA family ATPase [Chloroflexi bacterium]|nr:AAA family ATPase [Chloroflexota bacterium]
MIITRLKLTNWRNFTEVDVPLQDRAFIIGPNASGKSNLLDAIRFLRDVAKREGGGLQAAVRGRGGVPQIRSLSAHSGGGIGIEVHLSQDSGEPAEWLYRLVFAVEQRGHHRIVVQQEVVEHKGKILLQRPDSEDKLDADRLTETALEQINANRPFRAVAEFFNEVTYFHLVPQLVRFGAEIGGKHLENDPFGQGFLEKIAVTNTNTRKSRLNKIAASLKHIVPQLEEITFERDATNGQPHLRVRFENWRANNVSQREDQLSDGTLRLVGLFWSLLERGGPLLLEEPEISLNRDIVLRLAGLIYRLSVPVRRRRGTERHSERRQVILTTHSPDLLCDQGIGSREVLVITPGKDGSTVNLLDDDPGKRKVLEAGVMPGVIAPFRDQRAQLPMHLGLSL